MINVMREYFTVQLFETENQSLERANQSVSNILAGLLSVFQIIEVGAGQAFNVDEKDFVGALYAVIQRMFEQPQQILKTTQKDFIGLLMSIDLIFCKKKQISVEVINSFIKRLALM